MQQNRYNSTVGRVLCFVNKNKIKRINIDENLRNLIESDKNRIDTHFSTNEDNVIEFRAFLK